MIPAPKAMSQGSNGAGGGALTAFRGISAANAEPDTIASAVANKTHFFMTIPITFQKSVRFRHPPGTSDNRLHVQFRNVTPIWNATRIAGSKKGVHLLTF